MGYIEVLKPRESSLITFIGLCAAIIPAGGYPPLDKLLLIFIALLLGTAGVNGLTNYLDRNVDARMKRTRHRALPAKHINPPEKVLPLTIGMVIVGLAVAWLAHPLCFAAALAGTTAGLVWRKRWTCIFPQGIIASCTPVLMGWFAIRPTFSLELVLLCVLIAVWLPIHLWSVMVANREDYLDGGIKYFPVSREPRQVVKWLLLLSVVLFAASVGIYFVGCFSWLYIAFTGVLGAVLLYTSLRLVRSVTNRNSWRLYKLSSFPYLGLVFLAMCLDTWLH